MYTHSACSMHSKMYHHWFVCMMHMLFICLYIYQWNWNVKFEEKEEEKEGEEKNREKKIKDEKSLREVLQKSIGKSQRLKACKKFPLRGGRALWVRIFPLLCLSKNCDSQSKIYFPFFCYHLKIISSLWKCSHYPLHQCTELVCSETIVFHSCDKWNMWSVTEHK